MRYTRSQAFKFLSYTRYETSMKRGMKRIKMGRSTTRAWPTKRGSLRKTDEKKEDRRTKKEERSRKEKERRKKQKGRRKKTKKKERRRKQGKKGARRAKKEGSHDSMKHIV